MQKTLSRRDALKVFAGASALFTFDLPRLCAKAQDIAKGATPYFFLTQDEAAILTALCDRIIPKDEFPSASEAGVIDYIDLQLATGWGQGDGLYMDGPHDPAAPEPFGYQLPHAPAQMYRRALAAIAQSGLPDFLARRPEDLDAYLTRLEKGQEDLGDIPGRVFFQALRANTSEGYFADPIYNGNRDYVGWRMLGFPGADAYYLTEIDRYNMRYDRVPSGIAHRSGIGTAPFTARDVKAGAGAGG